MLPPGYDWHDFSAAELGTTAGFKIGLPGAWTQNLTGQIAHFNQPVRNFHLTVNVGLWTYPKPLAEAKYLAKKDSANYNGYTQLALGAVGFKAIGGFKAAPAAELKFSWNKPVRRQLHRVGHPGVAGDQVRSPDLPVQLVGSDGQLRGSARRVPHGTQDVPATTRRLSLQVCDNPRTLRSRAAGMRAAGLPFTRRSARHSRRCHTTRAAAAAHGAASVRKARG